jgi:hypothetical protein
MNSLKKARLNCLMRKEGSLWAVAKGTIIVLLNINN